MQTLTPDTMQVDITSEDPGFQNLLDRMVSLPKCDRLDMEASIFLKLAQQATVKASKYRHKAE